MNRTDQAVTAANPTVKHDQENPKESGGSSGQRRRGLLHVDDRPGRQVELVAAACAHNHLVTGKAGGVGGGPQPGDDPTEGVGARFTAAGRPR